LAVTDKDRARKAVVDILNTMPDREQANAYRRRLFSLLH
jgi:thioredoxin-like negative regulator of GroEL